ncbi:MAG: EamA family transporter [Verrucomicrobiota bacterium]
MPVATAERRRAIWLLLLTNLLWALSFPLIKSALLLQQELLPGVSENFSTLLTVAPRFVLAVLILLVLQPGQSWRATVSERRQGIMLGLFAAAGMLLQNDGLRYTSASTSAFLTQLYAVLIPVWVGLRWRLRPGRRVWMACGLVGTGVAVLAGFNPFDAAAAGFRLGRGEIETLLGSGFFMGQILILERKDFRENRAERITFVMFATQALIFGGAAVALAPGMTALVTPWTSPAWLALTLALCLFCSIGAISLMNACQPKISATEAGLIYCFEPVFVSLIALFLPAWLSRVTGISYPNETASWSLVIGGGLITAANLLTQAKPPEPGM